MPTSKHQASFSYRETHDLPTPPATTRPSPPSSSQRDSYHIMPNPQRLDSPYGQPPISASHGRVPHPSSIGLQQQSQHPTQQPQQQPQQQHQQHQQHQQQQQQQQQQPPPPPPPPLQASHQRPPHQNLAQNVQHGPQQSQHLPPPLTPSQHHHQGHDTSQYRNPQSQSTLPHSQQLPPQQPHQQPPHTITQGPVSAPPPAGSQSGISHHHTRSMTRPYDQSLGALPAPPPRWQDSEESMKGWLLAKTEEEKRRQEEEKTRQGTLRYEQRQIELEILRTSLSGGIPPTMIPFVFAGIGGITLPAGAMEWAQQAISSHHQHHGPQAPTSPGKRRESQPHSTCTGTPNPMPPAHGFVHPGSPAVRSSIGGGPTSATRPISAVHHASGTNTPNVSSYSFANQTGPEPQSGIYFHHWQPPSTQTQTVNNNTVSTQSSAPSGSSMYSSFKVKRIK
ncbi:hypothetical protein HOO65_010375 [Ceratocystis lukuohia]|uniref:Uncharacterized protein n=1 Tax=Ceratocystis lukuohia TaxID=2019550 RepID=A0ABR4MRY2_9PEZI